jgi:hypothetical protein
MSGTAAAIDGKTAKLPASQLITTQLQFPGPPSLEMSCWQQLLRGHQAAWCHRDISPAAAASTLTTCANTQA